MSTFRLESVSAAAFWLSTMALSSAAQADPADACTLLTATEVGAVAGGSMADGQNSTPTFLKTCTWNPSGKSDVKAVTLYLQTTAAYDGGKQMALQMAAASSSAGLSSAGVGDDSYYFVAGDQVGLLVKKGSVSFKVAIYATLPVARKEAMELALAKQVLAKL